MLGRIIGGYRSYWCLFGDAINMAARLASLSCKSEWKDRVAAAAEADR
jgi:class 3 adenylate cyclase